MSGVVAFSLHWLSDFPSLLKFTAPFCLSGCECNHVCMYLRLSLLGCVNKTYLGTGEWQPLLCNNEVVHKVTVKCHQRNSVSDG